MLRDLVDLVHSLHSQFVFSGDEIVEDFSRECSLDGEKITIDGLRINFENGWGLLRASNTTPKLVLRFEGNSVDDLNQIKNDFLNELSRICPNIDINLE